jgi:Protein kinase domain
LEDKNKKISGLDESIFEGVEMEGGQGSEPVSAQPVTETLKKFHHFFSHAALARLAVKLNVPPEKQQEVLRRYAKEVVEKTMGSVKCPESAGLLLELHYPTDIGDFKKQLGQLVSRLEATPDLLDLDEKDYEQCLALISRIRSDVVRLVEEELDAKGFKRKVGALAQKYGEGGFGKVFACRVGNENMVAKLMHPIEYDEDSDPPSYFQYPELIEATRKSENLVRYHGTLDLEWNYGAMAHLDFYEELKGYKTMDEYIYWDLGLEGEDRYRNLKSYLERLFLPVLNGVKALHDRKLVHGDLKELNVLVLPNGDRPEVKVGDYDLVRRSGFTPQGYQAMGSPTHMSPEQVASASLTEKSDIYSLGMMLYYTFGGLKSRNYQDMISRTTHEVDVSVLDCPRKLRHLIARCVSLSPQKRPSIDELIKGIERLVSDPEMEAEIQAHLPEGQVTQKMPPIKKAA